MEANPSILKASSLLASIGCHQSALTPLRRNHRGGYDTNRKKIFFVTNRMKIHGIAEPVKI